MCLSVISQIKPGCGAYGRILEMDVSSSIMLDLLGFAVEPAKLRA
jgi:hypothetical protein